MPGIEIQDISLEENTQLFEKLVQGFGKLGVVTKLLNHKTPPPLSHDILSKLIFLSFRGALIYFVHLHFIYNNKLVKINY